MKRKVLVLLLALTLVLSLMPMIAFADEAEEPASVNETIKEEKVQSEAEADETEIKDENASLDATAAEEEESADTFSQKREESETPGERIVERNLQTIPEQKALNACAHLRKEYKYSYDKDECTVNESGDKHEVRGEITKKIYCKICGNLIEEEKLDSITEDHHYDNGVCVVCGHLNTCTHENTETYYYNWDDEDVEYTSIDNAYHRITGQGELVCGDCKETIEVVENIDEKDYHNYEDFGSIECVDCHHINTCEHPSSYFEFVYDKDKCKIVDCGIDHEVTGKIEKVFICKTCEKIFKKVDPGNKVQEIHYYHGGDVCVYCGHDRNRIFGKARYDTAIGVADRYRETSGAKFENVIVADGRNYPDALSGGYLAKVRNAPILLVAPSEEDRIANYISKSIASNGTVYILGGTGAVSSAFEKRIENKRLKAVRLGGKDRYETNLNIMKAAGVKDENILVCTGSGYADSLSASAVGKPILLVGDTLTDTQKEYIEGLITKQFYLIGGTGAVTTKIETDLKNLGDYNITRLAGSTRYDTSTKVAKKFFPKATTVVLAYAQNFPDGLSGGSLAMLEGAPIVLTDSNHTTAAKTYIKSAGAIRSITLGGTSLISDIAVKAIMGR